VNDNNDKMTNNNPEHLPVPAFMGGNKAITMTPIAGTPRREYAEMFIPGEEALEDGELRVTVLGSGNPWNTRAQASASILKVFLTHLHADHTSDLITLSGSWSKVGRADGPIYVWGPSGTEPDLGTKHFVEGIEAAPAWDTAAGNGAINPERNSTSAKTRWFTTRMA
jgi:ribonuclease Z